MSRGLGIVALFVSLAFTASCDGGGEDAPEDATPSPTADASGGAPETTLQPGEPIRIGLSAGLTGDLALLGTPIRDAAHLAVEQRMQILGFPVQLVAEDDLCSGPGSEAVASRLIAMGVVAVVGPMCAGGTVATLDDYDRAHVAMISASASHGSVTDQGAENFVRTIWSDDTEGEEMARYIINTLAMRRAVLVHDGSAAASALVAAVESTMRELGGEPTSAEVVSQDEGASGVTAARIATSAPEIVVYAGGAAEGALLARTLDEAAYSGAMMVAGGAAERDFIDLAGGAAEGAFVSGGVEPIASSYDAFLAQYRERYGADVGTTNIEYAYDATMLLLDAVSSVATTEASGNLVIDRVRLIEEVKRARLENGASGTVAFEANGDRDIAAGGVNAMSRVTGGEAVRLP